MNNFLKTKNKKEFTSFLCINSFMSNEVKVFIAEKSVRKTTATEKKKTVYKHVLDSPFVLKWPKVHSDLGATILTELLK